MIEIVWDDSKNKLRAKPVNKQGWIRFPKKLRVEGALYKAELKRGKGDSWITIGEITLMHPGERAA